MGSRFPRILPHKPEHGEGEDDEPHGHEEIGGANVLAHLRIIGEAQPRLLRQDKADQRHREAGEAPDVAQRIAVPRDATGLLGPLEIGQECVVEDEA